MSMSPSENQVPEDCGWIGPRTGFYDKKYQSRISNNLWFFLFIINGLIVPLVIIWPSENLWLTLSFMLIEGFCFIAAIG